jgi:hypothetical protein
MAHTFWHSGILIGESDLEESSDHPRQRGGVFRPTAYGLEVFPRLTGILSAGHALKTHLEANGLSPEEMEGSEIDELLDTTAAGRKIIDIGRMLSEVEMRAPDGRRLEFASIAFSDLSELQRLVREMELVGAADDLTDLPPDAPRYIVSATLSEAASAPVRQARAGRLRRRHSSEDN